MIKTSGKDIVEIRHVDEHGEPREIAVVYMGGRLLWEKIRGFLFSKDGYSMQSKDGYLLKTKDQ